MIPTVKARYLLAWLVFSSVLGVVVVNALGLSPSSDREGSRQVSVGLLVWVMYPVLVLVTLLHARGAGVRVLDIVGQRVDPRTLLRSAILAVPLLGFALLALYVVFAPLSLVWPAGVQAWLFEDPPVFYDPGPPFRPLINLVSLAALAVAAPVAEEWFFRGLLLRRWSVKWSPTAGVVGSSLIFAALHADLLGAFVFGVVMCQLYSRSSSLWVPIVVHMAYNSLVALWVVATEHTGWLVGPQTVEQLRAAWWMPVVGVLLVAPWLRSLGRVCSNHKSSSRLDGAQVRCSDPDPCS